MAQRNLTPNNRDEQDEYNDPSLTASRLRDAEQNALEPTDDRADSDNTDPSAAVRESEASPRVPSNEMNYEPTGRSMVQKGKQAITVARRVQKFGPLGTALFFIVAGGIIATVSFPALILQHIEETITASLHDADPAINIRTKLAFKMKADAVKRGFAESSDGKCNIKCKFSTVNEKTKARMERNSAGVKVDLEKKAFGRYVIKKMTFADGTVVTNGDDFEKAIKNVQHASAFNRIFNPTSEPFLANTFSEMLNRKFPGLSKKSTLTSNDEKTNREQLARDLGIDDDATNEDGTPKTTDGTDDEKLAAGDKDLSEKINVGKESFSVKASAKANNIAAVGCAAYDLGKATQLAYSAQKAEKAAALFMVIANAASQARVGNLTPATASLVGKMLTEVDNQKTVQGKSNPFFGKSFTDSSSYKMSAFGDNAKLTDRDKSYGLAPQGVTGGIAQLTGFLNSNKATGPTALVATHTTCKFVNGPVGTLVSCLPEAAGGTVVPGLGNAVALLGCAIISTAVGYIASQALNLVLPAVIKQIVANDIGSITTNVAGPAAATLARVGGGEILGTGLASQYGLMPGTQAEVKTYKSDTVAERESMVALKTYDARSEPLDASNQYSFLGSTIRSLGLLDMNYSSLSGVASWFGSASSAASLAFMPTTYAATDLQTRQAALYSDTDCSDPALVDIGVACDGLGVPSFTMSTGEMSVDPGDNTDKMINMGAVDDDSGEPIESDSNANASDYSNYTKYCVDRQANYGQMSASIDDDDFGWDSGYLCGCTEKKVDGLICTTDLASKLHTFRSYAMDKALFDAGDDDPLPGQSSDGTSGGDSAAASVDVSTVPNTCSNTVQTGSGISLYSNLSGSPFDDRVNSAPNTNSVSLDAGSFSFNNFSSHGGRVGADITQSGLLGAGVGRTIISMNANSSNKSGVVPSKSWTTNPLYLMRFSKDNVKLDCFTLKGTDQGHLYNGIRLDHVSGAQVSNIQLVGASPGKANYPPGETFAINDWGGKNNVYKNVELDGANKGAAAFGTNSATGGTWVNSSAHDFKYSHGWAMWQQKGGAILEGCSTINNWNGVNLERVNGTVTLKNMTFGGNHTDIAGGDDQNNNLKVVVIDPILKGQKKITVGWWKTEMGKPNKWGTGNIKVIVNGVDKTNEMIDWKAKGSG